MHYQGVLIGMGSKRKKEREATIRNLVTQIGNLETLLKQSLSIESAKKLLDVRKDLKQLLDYRAKRMLFFQKKLYYESGNKSSKFFARALREHNSTNSIEGIKREDGKLDVATEAIAEHFHNFYTKLYNQAPQHRQPHMEGDRIQIIQDYLLKSGLPTLPDPDSDLLEALITAIELRQAIKQLKLGKSPGPDGYSSIYYKTFINIIKDPLMAALNSLSTPRGIIPVFLSAHIMVIPKVGKDPADCASYHPTSLLNLDVKLKNPRLTAGSPPARADWSRAGGIYAR